MKPSDRHRLLLRLRGERCPRCRARSLDYLRHLDAVMCHTCGSEYPVERFT